jgi:hypothetical protein
MKENRTNISSVSSIEVDDWFSEAYESAEMSGLADRAEQRTYDYKLKRETLESFTKWFTTLYGPDVITNKHIEQWLTEHS